MTTDTTKIIEIHAREVLDSEVSLVHNKGEFAIVGCGRNLAETLGGIGELSLASSDDPAQVER